MKLTKTHSKIPPALFAAFLAGVSLCAVHGQEGATGKTSLKIPGGISNQEYRDGAEQKKLSISDPEKALKEKFWNACAAIALGDGYSVILQFRQAHPIVAEYHRRVMIFAGSARRGKLSASLQLSMNYGGRTHMLVYRHLDKHGKLTHVTFEAREGGAQSIRLSNPDFEEPPMDGKKEYLGLVSGAAYPLKFFTPRVMPEKLAREKME